MPVGIKEGAECPRLRSAVGLEAIPSPRWNNLRQILPIFAVGNDRALDVPDALPITWETGMTTDDFRMDPRRNGRGKIGEELAERLEGYIERRASGRIRDLHVVCCDDSIILQG